MYFLTGSSGIANIPDFVGVGELDGIEAGYCDINNKIIQPRQDWAKQILDDDRARLEMYTFLCFENLPDFFKEFIFTLKQQFNQTGGAVFPYICHIIINHRTYVKEKYECTIG